MVGLAQIILLHPLMVGLLLENTFSKTRVLGENL